MLSLTEPDRGIMCWLYSTQETDLYPFNLNSPRLPGPSQEALYERIPTGALCFPVIFGEYRADNPPFFFLQVTPEALTGVLFPPKLDIIMSARYDGRGLLARSEPSLLFQSSLVRTVGHLGTPSKIRSRIPLNHMCDR